MTAEEYNSREAELFEKYKIPKEFREELSYLAYEQRHAYGYDEVFNILGDIVYSLSTCFENFAKNRGIQL